MWLGLSALAEWTLVHPPHFRESRTPAAFGEPYRELSFPSGDGIALAAWWIPGSEHRTVVVIHGFRGNSENSIWLTSFIHQAGYNLLLLDLRGHGRSGGDQTTFGVRETMDVRAAVAAARSLDPGPVALLGYSLGGSVALTEAGTDPSVAAVIDESGFARLSEVVSAGFQHFALLPYAIFGPLTVAIAERDIGISTGRVRPIDFAAQLRKPVLVIAGSSDTTVPLAQSRELYAALPGPKRLLVAPGAGHLQAWLRDRAEYERITLQFLAEAMPR